MNINANAVNSVWTASQVADRLHSMSSYYDLTKQSEFFLSLEVRLRHLYDLYNTFQGLEQEAYNKIGVENLQELQGKIDEINRSGMRNFSARVLENFPIMEEATGSMLTQAEKIDIINKEIESALNGGPSIFSGAIKNMEENATSNLGEEVLNSISGFFSGLRITEGGGGMSATAFKKQFTVKGNQIKMTKISSTYGKEINLAVNMAQREKTNKYIGYNVAVDWNENDSNKLNYYPYYGLTASQKAAAENDKQTWELFKNKVASLAPQYFSYIIEAMEQIGQAPFYAGSPANISGILGELGAMVMLKIINPNLAVKYTGSSQNLFGSMKGQQLGVDVFLEDIGFQVKNYKGYGFGEEGKAKGVHLKGSYSLPNFAEKIEGVPPQDLIDAKVFQYFHIQIDPDFSGVRALIDSVNGKFEQAYIGSIDNFMPLEQKAQLTEGGPVEIHRNLFYLIGGNQVVSSSSILSSYISQLEKTLAYFKDIQKGEGSVFNVTSSYGGPTYADYAANKLKSFSYSGAASSITMNYDINLYIPYL